MMYSGLLRATGVGQEGCAEVSRWGWGFGASSPDPHRSVSLGITVLPSTRALPQAAGSLSCWLVVLPMRHPGQWVPPCHVWVLPRLSSSSKHSAFARCFLPRCVAAQRLWKLSAFSQSPQCLAEPPPASRWGSDGQRWCRQLWRWGVKHLAEGAGGGGFILSWAALSWRRGLELPGCPRAFGKGFSSSPFLFWEAGDEGGAGGAPHPTGKTPAYRFVSRAAPACSNTAL